MTAPVPTVFIPAPLCDGDLYADVIARLGQAIVPHVMMSPMPCLEDSVADILARAPERLALVGTSYGGMLALAVARAAPERVSALWLRGCDAAAPRAGGPDLAAGLETTPDAVIDMLAGLVVHPDAVEAAARFKAMAHRVGGAAGAAQARAAASRAEAEPRLAGLTMPVLLVWGAEDALVPRMVGERLWPACCPTGASTPSTDAATCRPWRSRRTARSCSRRCYGPCRPDPLPMGALRSLQRRHAHKTMPGLGNRLLSCAPHHRTVPRRSRRMPFLGVSSLDLGRPSGRPFLSVAV